MRTNKSTLSALSALLEVGAVLIANHHPVLIGRFLAVHHHSTLHGQQAILRISFFVEVLDNKRSMGSILLVLLHSIAYDDQILLLHSLAHLHHRFVFGVNDRRIVLASHLQPLCPSCQLLTLTVLGTVLAAVKHCIAYAVQPHHVVHEQAAVAGHTAARRQTPARLIIHCVDVAVHFRVAVVYIDGNGAQTGRRT